MSEDQGHPTDEGSEPTAPDMRPFVAPEAFDAGRSPVPARRRPTAYVAVVIGLLAMVGGAIFFVRSIGSSGSGAKTPKAAVQRMFDALSREDALGVLEALSPAERDLLTGRVRTMTRELGRLGILRTNVDLGRIGGIDLAFTGLKFSTETLSTDIAVVKVIAGHSTYRIDPASSPLGDFLRGLLPKSSTRVVTGSNDLTGNDVALAAIRDGGSWYVSLGYSIAESARRSAGAPLPQFGNGVPARGAATPEAAVEQFLRSAASLDVRRLVELMPPDEAAALHDYASLFIDNAEKAAADIRQGVNVRIPTLTLSSKTSGDEAVVKIDKIAFSVSANGFAVSYDGRCATFDVGGLFGGGTGAPQRVCDKGLAPSTGLPFIPARPDLGFSAVRRGGVWYVSPTRTVLDGFIAILKALKASDLEQMKQFFGAFTRRGPFGSVQPLYPLPSATTHA